MTGSCKFGSYIYKSICIIAAVYGCFTISEGLSTFTKFTTISNIGIAVAVIIVLLDEIAVRRGRAAKPSQGKYLFKFMMTVSILITFMLFLFILAPTNDKGFIGAYLNNSCGSLAHHFIAPLAAIIDFFVYDRAYIPKKSHVLFSMVVPAIYVIYIVILAGLGYRWPNGMYAPYNFLNFGAPTGWWGFDVSIISSTTLGIGVAYLIVVLLLLFTLIGAGMLALKKRISHG